MECTRFCCDATNLGKKEIRGCVTSQSLHVLIDTLREKRKKNFPCSNVSENECQIECSIDGLKIFYKRNDEGFESDADSSSPHLRSQICRSRRKNPSYTFDSDSSSDGGNCKEAAGETVSELFTFEDIHFCHTEPENSKLIVWVTVSKQPQSLSSTRHARVFECVNESSALKLAQVFSEQSKRLRLERYRHALSNSIRTKSERDKDDSSANSRNERNSSTEGSKFYLECEEILRISKMPPYFYPEHENNPGRNVEVESLRSDFRILSVRQRISPVLLKDCDSQETAGSDGNDSRIRAKKKRSHGKGPAPCPPYFSGNYVKSYVPNSVLVPLKSEAVARRSMRDVRGANSSSCNTFRFRLIPASRVSSDPHDRSSNCQFFPLSPYYSAVLMYPSEINIKLESGKRSEIVHQVLRQPYRQNLVRKPASVQISCSEMSVLPDSLICLSQKLKDFKIFLRRKINSPPAKISDCGSTALASGLPLEMQTKSVMKKASDKSPENKKVTFNDYTKVQFVD